MKYLGIILLAISLSVVKSDHHSGEAGNKPPARPPPPPPARPAQAPKPQQAPPRPAQPRPQAPPKPNQEPSKVASAQGGLVGKGFLGGLVIVILNPLPMYT